MTNPLAIETSLASPLLADVNIEFGHFYCYPPGSSRLKSQLQEARRTMSEAAHLTQLLKSQGFAASTMLMVDDVNETHPYQFDDILDVIVDWELQPDYLAFESEMIPLVQRHMPEAPVDCHHLTIAWYLARLGYAGFALDPRATTAFGLLFPAKRIYTVLPARFMSIEAAVQQALRRNWKIEHGKVRWVFV